MKFVHIADMHFDSPFTNLVTENHLGEARRLEQRRILKKIIDYIKENKIEYFFIAGDLFEQKYVRRSTVDYMIQLFQEIPNTKIFITPGNHDPLLKNSFYATIDWGKNVIIFGGEIERIEENNIDIYGLGFTDFYMEKSPVENIEIKNKEKINILITHASLNASDKLEKLYQPISENKMEKLNFDYIALGHIHKKWDNQNEKNRILYPGSTISLGFDEPGEHGMIVGEIEKNKTKIEFIPLDETYFEERELDISEINSEEELIEKINEIKIQKNKFIKIILIGKRKFEIQKNKILKLIENKNILKIKNNTKLNYELEELAKENNVKGIFVRNMLKKLEENIDQKEEIEKAIEIGLEIILNQ